MDDKRLFGIIVFYGKKKGFGYIKNASIKEKIFFHYKDVISYMYYDIKEKNIVSFDINLGEKGYYATRIKIEKGEVYE